MTSATTTTRRRLFKELFTEAENKYCRMINLQSTKTVTTATMTPATSNTRRRLFTEALQQQHCIIALHCNANNIEAALQQHCNATTTTTTTTTTRRSVFTEALQQQHCYIALHC